MAIDNGRKTPSTLRAIGLVFVCTLIGAAAQILMKYGTAQLPAHVTARDVVLNLSLLAGFICYGINTVLLVMALRHGHLSVLYPIIALTYVWVTILSPRFFPTDRLNAWKVSGVSVIVCGVSLIGRGSRP